ncbi:low-density lipoprotein receptor 1-like isoform X1 [Mytilus edulis]|uniref:low-density lipoprotein receptor 1-like isoform X1 n=1 Tax=Mytilus edulis TaxID=6550 RepID=UPI0039EFF2A6
MNYLPLTMFVIGFCTNLSLSVTENNCENGDIKCRDNVQCIRNRGLCNGYVQCNDQSDEDPDFCRETQCGRSEVKCKDGLQCIFKSDLCDKYEDCDDGSDEEEYGCKAEQCLSYEVKCKNGLQCISKSYVCDNDIDCDDGSDEENCNEAKRNINSFMDYHRAVSGLKKSK